MSWRSWHGELLINRVEDACAKGAMDAMNAIGTESLQQVPHDTGELSQSWFVKADPNDSRRVLGSYGGGMGTGIPKVPYALRWHETQANFQKGRKWKYLRDPLFMQGSKALLRAIAERMRAIL